MTHISLREGESERERERKRERERERDRETDRKRERERERERLCTDSFPQAVPLIVILGTGLTRT